MTYTKLEKEHKELKEAVSELFSDYLDVVEESDSGREFHPIFISCCRALKLEPLNNLLKKLKELSKE
jgi:3'-phosphoadenosine 5'-phosphosulfate sulfotransferase (PAPS reductase)/FAD synthetase